MDFLPTIDGSRKMKENYGKSHRFSLLYIREILFDLGFLELHSEFYSLNMNILKNISYKILPALAPMYIGIFRKNIQPISPIYDLNYKKINLNKERHCVTSSRL